MDGRFHTVRGYEMQSTTTRLLTPALEDYLEMIYRCSLKEPYIRVNSLAQFLNVKDPSASRMVKKLGDLGYVHYEKYGIVTLSEKGREAGAFLLNRHGILEKFFAGIGCGDALELAEMMEHFITVETAERIKMVYDFLNSSPEMVDTFAAFKQKHLDRKK